MRVIVPMKVLGVTPTASVRGESAVTIVSGRPSAEPLAVMSAAAWSECFDGVASGLSPQDADWFATCTAELVDGARRPVAELVDAALAGTQASPAARVRVMERVGSLAASPAWSVDDCGEAAALAFTLAAIDAAVCCDDAAAQSWFRRARQAGGEVPAGGSR